MQLHPESGAPLLNLPCALRGVLTERLCDPHWWLLALRPLLFPAEGHGPAPLYEQVRARVRVRVSVRVSQP